MFGNYAPLSLPVLKMVDMVRMCPFFKQEDMGFISSGYRGGRNGVEKEAVSSV